MGEALWRKSISVVFASSVGREHSERHENPVQVRINWYGLVFLKHENEHEHFAASFKETHVEEN